MKTLQLVETRNVIEATALVDDLLKRDVTEFRGLALAYGQTGTGKTAWAERLGFSRGWLFYRMKKTDKPKSFLVSIHQRLNRRYCGDEVIPFMMTPQLEGRIIDILCDHPETVIIIDEINLMVGEETTRAQLEKYNRHFFDRCSFFYEFKPNTVENYRRFIDEVSDVKFDATIAEWLHRQSEGNLRQAGKMLAELEKLALSQGRQSATLTDLLQAV